MTEKQITPLVPGERVYYPQRGDTSDTGTVWEEEGHFMVVWDQRQTGRCETDMLDPETHRLCEGESCERPLHPGELPWLGLQVIRCAEQGDREENLRLVAARFAQDEAVEEGNDEDLAILHALGLGDSQRLVMELLLVAPDTAAGLAARAGWNGWRRKLSESAARSAIRRLENRRLVRQVPTKGKVPISFAADLSAYRKPRS